MSVLIDYSSGAFASNQAQGVGTVTASAGDADFSKVTLLMHMDGSNGSTTFTDSTSNNHSSTAAGNAQLSTTASKFGGASAYFDGVGDYITVNSNSAAYVSNQDFTIECWINYTFSGSSETRMIVISGGQQTNTSFDYFQIAVKDNNSLYAEHRVYRGTFSTPANSLTPNTWHHIALVRDSTSTRFYIDGVEEASTTAWAGKILRTQTPATVTIGHQNAETGFDNEYPGEYYKGYIDEVRVTKNLARYTSTFTPPTAAFLGASGPINLDISSGNYFNYTPTANTTFTFGNAPASGTAAGFALAVTPSATVALTYPSSVKWPSGTAPDAPASGETDVLVFLTDDNGTSYQGFQAGDAMSLPLAGSSSAFNEASELGTATQTITTFPQTNLSTTNSGLQDYTYATDFSTSSGDTGTIFEIGGSTFGLNISLYNNLIEVQAANTTNATGDFSSHMGETGTLYVSADYQNKIDVYWYSSNTMTLIVSTPTSGDYAGTDASGVGARGGGTLYGTNRNSFSGTITEWRNWSNTYFDFSPFV